MPELRQAQLGQLGRLGGPALVVVDVQRDFGDPACLGSYGLSESALAALDLGDPKGRHRRLRNRRP